MTTAQDATSATAARITFLLADLEAVSFAIAKRVSDVRAFVPSDMIATKYRIELSIADLPGGLDALRTARFHHHYGALLFEREWELTEELQAARDFFGIQTTATA